MFARFSPSSRTKSDIRFIFIFLFSWLPAFGWMPDSSITFEVMKVSAIVVVLLTLYVWISKVQTESSRAWIYIAILITPLFLTCLIFYIRFVELLVYTFSLSVTDIIIWALAVLIFSAQRIAAIYHKEAGKIKVLRSLGLLTKYKIFDEDAALWNITPYFPGIDGSTPEEEARKGTQKWGCISLLPISGISFYLIRTTQGSVAWVLLFIYILIYSSFLIIGIKLLATLIQIWQWESELGVSIYTDVSKQE